VACSATRNKGMMDLDTKKTHMRMAWGVQGGKIRLQTAHPVG
jgi:hypothetical protein